MDSHTHETVPAAKQPTQTNSKPPTEIVFAGLCLFIATDDYVAVALLKPLANHTHGANAASDHTAYLYEHGKDMGTVGEAPNLRSFPDETGGQWVGKELKGARTYGVPADGKPDTSGLQNKQYRLPNLRKLGKQGKYRDLDILWPNLAQAIVVLYGGTLELREPVIGDFRIDWDFRTEEYAKIPMDMRMFLGEQVVWKPVVKVGTPPTTVLIANVPFETIKPERKKDPLDGSEKQLKHFESFYQVFTGESKKPVLLPTNPSGEVEVYPIFCPPAMYEA